MPEELLDFKTVTEKFDITPRTLRYYEYLELISPVREGKKRFYTKRELARIELILRGRRFGFKLEQVRQWLEMYDPQSGNEEQNRLWIDLATSQIDELKQRQRELAEVIRELEELRSVVEAQLPKA